MSENTKTSWKGPASPLLRRAIVAPSLNFMFVPSSRNKHAVAKCCAQLGRVVERLGSGKGGGPCRKCFPFFAAFCDSRKTLEKMAQPSHPCLKPGLHNRQFFFVSSSFLSTRVSRPCSRPKTRLTARRYSMSIDWSLCYQCLCAKSVFRSHFCLLNEGW